MASEARARRIANRIHEEIAKLFQQDVGDPRLSSVTVTGVEVDRELAYATVYVTSFGDRERMDEILAVLDKAKGFLRRQLAALIQLRSFPMLRFRWDSSPETGDRVEELLDALRREEAADEEDGEH